MPPIARKKRVPERYNPDSFRVISTTAEDAHPKFPGDQIYSSPEQEQVKRGITLPNIYNRSTQVLPKEVPDYRVHRPHPNSCGFLRHNVRILNEPICSVYTGETHQEQHQWWPSRTSDEPLHIPPKTKDTIYRDGYMRDEPMSAKGFTRHASNPNKEAALGVVPVNFLKAKDGQPRIFEEKISFEHQYNCRVDPNYPIRNKRHGSFVWAQPTKEASERFIAEQKKLDEIERCQVKLSDGATIDTVPVFASPQSPKQDTSESVMRSPKRLTPPATAIVQLTGGGDGLSKQEQTNNVQESSVAV